MINSGAISVRIGMFPEMNTTEPYSPTPRANASAKPVSHAGYRYGKMIRPSTYSRDAPRLVAASSISASAPSMTDCSVLTTKGRPINTSATTMPRGVNATFTPHRPNVSPIQPFGEYNVVKVIPATAVGSANGRSISASTTRFPGNSYRASTHATRNPKIAFTAAAASAAPTLSLYDATTRSSLIVRQI